MVCYFLCWLNDFVYLQLAKLATMGLLPWISQIGINQEGRENQQKLKDDESFPSN